MAAKGLSSTRSRHARSGSPAFMWPSQPWMFSPAGQARLHGGSRSTYKGRSTRTGPARARPCNRSGRGVTSPEKPLVPTGPSAGRRSDRWNRRAGVGPSPVSPVPAGVIAPLRNPGPVSGRLRLSRSHSVVPSRSRRSSRRWVRTGRSRARPAPRRGLCRQHRTRRRQGPPVMLIRGMEARRVHTGLAGGIDGWHRHDQLCGGARL